MKIVFRFSLAAFLYVLGFLAPQARAQRVNGFEPGAEFNAWQTIGGATMAVNSSCILMEGTQAGDVDAPGFLDGVWLDVSALPTPAAGNRFCLVDVCFTAASAAVSVQVWDGVGAMKAAQFSANPGEILGVDMWGAPALGNPVSVVILMAGGTVSFDYLRYASVYYTATMTHTGTFTATPSATPSSTPSPSPTWSPTRTNSSTFTISPTFTDSMTATPSPTISPSPSISPTFSASASPTESGSPTPSPTISATSTVSPTGTVSATASASLTPSASATASASATVSETVAGSLTPTPSATPTRTITPAAARAPVAYPNPLRLGGKGPSGHDGVIFARLRSGDSLRIYTLDGRLVKSLDAADLEDPVQNPLLGLVGARGDNDLVWKWNVENDLGEPVVMGLYLAAVQHEDGSKDVVKVAVIR